MALRSPALYISHVRVGFLAGIHQGASVAWIWIETETHEAQGALRPTKLSAFVTAISSKKITYGGQQTSTQGTTSWRATGLSALWVAVGLGDAAALLST